MSRYILDADMVERRINGELWVGTRWYDSRSEAIADAEKIRAEGLRARVVSLKPPRNAHPTLPVHYGRHTIIVPWAWRADEQEAAGRVFGDWA